MALALGPSKECSQLPVQGRIHPQVQVMVLVLFSSLPHGPLNDVQITWKLGFPGMSDKTERREEGENVAKTDAKVFLENYTRM